MLNFIAIERNGTHLKIKAMHYEIRVGFGEGPGMRLGVTMPQVGKKSKHESPTHDLSNPVRTLSNFLCKTVPLHIFCFFDEINFY